MNFKLAVRNVLRHRTRSIISILAIASAVISLVLAGGFIEDTVQQVREAFIRDFLGHVRIYKPGFRQEWILHPFDFMIADPDRLIKELSVLPHVRYLAPRLMFGGLISTGETTFPVMVDSSDPAIEGGQRNT